MKFLANILTSGTFNEYAFCNVVSKKDDIIEGIPTLCIGYEFAKKNYKGINILDWKIDESTFWTYGKRERRNVYEEKVKKFIDYSIESSIKSIDYVFISLFLDSDKKKEYLFENVKSENTYYYIDNVIYIYVPSKRVSYGISSDELSYFGIEKEKLLSFLKKNNSKEIKVPKNNNFYFSSILNKNKYAIPYFFS